MNIPGYITPVAWVLTLVLGKFIIPQLQRLKAGQSIRQDGPTWHNGKAGTPTMGGLMFILSAGVLTVLGGWNLMLSGDFTHLYIYAFALVFGIVGFIDDYCKVKKKQNEGLTAKQKFLLQLVAAVGFVMLMRYEGLVQNALYIPFVNVSINLPWVAYMVFAAFVIVGCVNAVNITDGVDGLAGTVTLVTMLFFAVMGRLLMLESVLVVSCSLLGGLLGFLHYNLHPAKVFMGDTGSLFLGGAVAALAFALDAPLVLIPVGIVYIAETMSDIIQVGYFKATHGKRFFKMAPLHHHFELCGWSEKKVVTVFTAVTVVGCAIALLGMLARI